MDARVVGPAGTLSVRPNGEWDRAELIEGQLIEGQDLPP